MTTMQATSLPTLYADSLPTDPRDCLRETLRRVQRISNGGPFTLMYRLTGVAGEWWLTPEGYYLPGKKHKGRKGPFVVEESFPDYKKGEKQIFESEADAWAWVTAEHARRVDAHLVELVTAEAERCEQNAEHIRRKLDAVEAEVALWRSWLK